MRLRSSIDQTPRNLKLFPLIESFMLEPMDTLESLHKTNILIVAINLSNNIIESQTISIQHIPV